MRDFDFNKGLFLNISQFADIVKLTTETLRHYDREGIFPAAQIIGNSKHNHQRLYNPTQITKAKMVHVLSEIGVKLADIKELVDNRTPALAMKLLSKQQSIIADELQLL